MNKRFGLLVTGVIVGLAVVGSLAYGISATTQPQPVAVVAQSVSQPPTKAELLALVNAERAKNGVAPLVEDSRLDTTAQTKANDEVTYKYFGHISPSISPYAGLHGYQLIPKAGIKCVYESENLSENLDGHDSSENIVLSWIKSPAHHAAMIDARYTITGFGINDNQIVEHFCQQ